MYMYTYILVSKPGHSRSSSTHTHVKTQIEHGLSTFLNFQTQIPLSFQQQAKMVLVATDLTPLLRASS